MLAASPAAILLAGIAVLSGMDALIKHLSATNHTLVVALGRYLFGTVFALGIWLHARAPRITWAMWKAHTLRGAVIALAGVSFFWSISVLPLAEAVAYAFFYTLIVPFVASAIIGERVRGASFAAAALGFVGVVIAAQGAPSMADDPLHAWGVAAVIFSSFAFAISVALMRARAQADGAAIVGVLASFIPGMLILAPTLIFAPPPRMADWPSFLLLGVLAAAGMYLVARAYAKAEAQQLAPIHYSELLYAAAFGYFLFQETPRPQVLIGACVIVVACLWAAYDERRLTLRAGAAE